MNFDMKFNLVEKPEDVTQEQWDQQIEEFKQNNQIYNKCYLFN